MTDDKVDSRQYALLWLFTGIAMGIETIGALFLGWWEYTSPLWWVAAGGLISLTLLQFVELGSGE